MDEWRGLLRLGLGLGLGGWGWGRGALAVGPPTGNPCSPATCRRNGLLSQAPDRRDAPKIHQAVCSAECGRCLAALESQVPPSSLSRPDRLRSTRASRCPASSFPPLILSTADNPALHHSSLLHCCGCGLAGTWARSCCCCRFFSSFFPSPDGLCPRTYSYLPKYSTVQCSALQCCCRRRCPTQP